MTGDGDPTEALEEGANDEVRAPGDHDVEERDPYKRRVAVLLALFGVLGGWIGILHNDSGNSESTYARETTRTAVGSLRANVNQSTVEGLGKDLDAEQAALGLAAPFRIDQAAGEEVDPAEQQDELAEAAAGLDEQDREALERDLTTEAAELDLRRHALAETRVTYNNRTSQYETVLTTLAVALFLVGFTLVLDRRIRPPVLVPGLLLAAYVAGWALWIHQRPIPTTDPDAIAAAAQGTMHQEFGEFEDAAERYGDAIVADDDFRPAYTGRSISSFLAANPDFARTLAVTRTTGALVDQAQADAEEAVRLGENEDFNSLLVSGVYRFYDGDYDGAVERLTAATEVNDKAPEAFELLAAAELARGDGEAAGAALDSALALLDLDAETEANRQYAADLFTLLEQVEHAVPERTDEVDALRKRLAAGEARLVFGDELPAGGAPDATFTVDRADFEDGVLSSRGTYDGLPEGSEVSLYVYEQPAAGAAYAQAAELARFATLEGSGTLEGDVEIDRACTPVAFRFDIYVNGELVDSIEEPGGEPTC